MKHNYKDMLADIIPIILSYSKGFKELRLVSELFRYYYDRLFARTWNMVKICENVDYAMNIKPNIEDICCANVKDWVFGVVSPHNYIKLIHSANTIKLSYSLTNIMVRVDCLDKLDAFDKKRVNWDAVAANMDTRQLMTYANYIKDWSNVKVKPLPEIIYKCHNRNMFNYICEHYDIYSLLNSDLLDILGEYVNWANVVSRCRREIWIRYILFIDWRGISDRVYANSDNAKYIDWTIYSRRGLTDDDFVKRSHYIYTNMIEEVWMINVSLLNKHMLMYGELNNQRILVNGKPRIFNRYIGGDNSY